MHFGIDYGSKLAGTSAICFEKQGALHILQSQRKKDADHWISSVVKQEQPDQIFMDAPLSLPDVYRGKGTDYFYRACDRELNAMSPMFLGGLTARAMRLSHLFLQSGIEVFETYPAQLVRLLDGCSPAYQKKSKDLAPFLSLLSDKLPYPFVAPPDSWHQADAVLAWLSGQRYQDGNAVTYGKESEGQIWV